MRVGLTKEFKNHKNNCKDRMKEERNHKCQMRLEKKAENQLQELLIGSVTAGESTPEAGLHQVLSIYYLVSRLPQFGWPNRRVEHMFWAGNEEIWVLATMAVNKY